ncbi:AarF/ABC1/UbiB kinase family protein [Oceanimonas sp. CHS3-5]|uniref:ABC1 kinase family protein n=1 Tax=Oceanimonas sp. CHS3-5 TaxID=3068186 RepID=UPI00273F0A97|nr:AarF/ABC1/UbiB kinase family protein [Oceanimonas sp. CHS3-5]MDP5291131.1 AarF/ABC1/UbiB kinase family protein [Oceanimonas sp. CHS3-5]
MSHDDKGTKVPGHRLARMGHLASLATRVAGGMLGEGARRLAQGERPRARELLLTPANARRVGDQLARLRGAAMKVGQLLSMDAGDLLPPELAEILARLRAEGSPMPAAQLSAVLKQELGTDWQRHFAHFEFRPLAAASIGQVHKAWADDGEPLAVKIQYPGIADSINSDVDNVASLLKLSGLVPAGVDYQSLLAEAKQQLHAEADYELEARQLGRFNALLANDDRFVLPQNRSDISTSRLLAMSFVEGQPIEGLAEQPEARRNHLLALLFELLFRELFEFNLVQTDPNFANFLYQDERLVLLDFGATREYAPGFAQGYRRLFAAALADNEPAMEQALTDIGFFSQHILPAQKQAVIGMVRLACEPLQRDAPFDFGNSTLAQRLREAGTALSMRQDYWHSPPADALFLHRKIGGLYLLAARLGARVNVRKQLQPWL